MIIFKISVSFVDVGLFIGLDCLELELLDVELQSSDDEVSGGKLELVAFLVKNSSTMPTGRMGSMLKVI